MHETRVPTPLRPAQSGPAIGLALGGGGARGLAHVVMLEAFDELGLRPKVIAGTSIGAVIGAAYASGMTAREIRAQMQEVLSARFELARDLFAARARTRRAQPDPLLRTPGDAGRGHLQHDRQKPVHDWRRF